MAQIACCWMFMAWLAAEYLIYVIKQSVEGNDERRSR